LHADKWNVEEAEYEVREHPRAAARRFFKLAAQACKNKISVASQGHQEGLFFETKNETPLFSHPCRVEIFCRQSKIL
jgi:hypothetical protein